MRSFGGNEKKIKCVIKRLDSFPIVLNNGYTWVWKTFRSVSFYPVGKAGECRGLREYYIREFNG